MVMTMMTQRMHRSSGGIHSESESARSERRRHMADDGVHDDDCMGTRSGLALDNRDAEALVRIPGRDDSAVLVLCY